MPVLLMLVKYTKLSIEYGDLNLDCDPILTKLETGELVWGEGSWINACNFLMKRFQ
jgi:hypothetical protein